jgi:hypothetical protein
LQRNDSVCAVSYALEIYEYETTKLGTPWDCDLKRRYQTFAVVCSEVESRFHVDVMAAVEIGLCRLPQFHLGSHIARTSTRRERRQCSTFLAFSCYAIVSMLSFSPPFFLLFLFFLFFSSSFHGFNSFEAMHQ